MQRKKAKIFLIIGAVLFIAGGGLFAVPTIGEFPDVNCQTRGVTSGFAIEKDGEVCRLSREDLRKYMDWKDSAVPLHQAGLVLAVVGLGCVITGAVKMRKAKKEANNLNTDPANPTDLA